MISLRNLWLHVFVSESFKRCFGRFTFDASEVYELVKEIYLFSKLGHFNFCLKFFWKINFGLFAKIWLFLRGQRFYLKLDYLSHFQPKSTKTKNFLRTKSSPFYAEYEKLFHKRFQFKWKNSHFKHKNSQFKNKKLAKSVVHLVLISIQLQIFINYKPKFNHNSCSLKLLFCQTSERSTSLFINIHLPKHRTTFSRLCFCHSFHSSPTSIKKRIKFARTVWKTASFVWNLCSALRTHHRKRKRETSYRGA
jgi:hypothetical protein